MSKSNPELRIFLPNTPVSLAWINTDVNALGIKIDGKTTEPSVENIRNGSYPLSRNLYLITKGTPNNIVKDFIIFIQNAQGQKIVEENGFISIEQ